VQAWLWDFLSKPHRWCLYNPDDWCLIAAASARGVATLGGFIVAGAPRVPRNFHGENLRFNLYRLHLIMVLLQTLFRNSKFL
jgi:hypothetical protein